MSRNLFLCIGFIFFTSLNANAFFGRKKKVVVEQEESINVDKILEQNSASEQYTNLMENFLSTKCEKIKSGDLKKLEQQINKNISKKNKISKTLIQSKLQMNCQQVLEARKNYTIDTTSMNAVDEFFAHVLEDLLNTQCKDIDKKRLKKLKSLVSQQNKESSLNQDNLKKVLQNECERILYSDQYQSDSTEDTGEQCQKSPQIIPPELFNQFKQFAQFTTPQRTSKQGLTNNAGILYGANKNPKSGKKNKYYIARSSRLDHKKMSKVAQDFDKNGVKPIVSQYCIEKYWPKMKDQQLEICQGHPHIINQLKEEVQSDPQCKEFFYHGKTQRPTIAYLHIYGFNKNQERGDFAIQESVMSKVFGYNFYSPLSMGDKSTFVTGENILRPVLLTNDNKDFYSCQRNQKTYFNKYDTEKFKKFSSIGKACAGQDRRRVQHTRNTNLNKVTPSKDCGQNIGGWPDMFDTLDVILDINNLPVNFHCYGGRHKTGLVAMFLRLLEGGQWVDGKKTSKLVFEKPDISKGSSQIDMSDPKSLTKFNELHPPLKRGIHAAGNKIKQLFSTLKNYKRPKLNMAQLEYAEHNTAGYRHVNVTSAMEFYQLVEKPGDKRFEQKMLNKYKGNLTPDGIIEMRRRWKGLKKKFQDVQDYINTQNAQN